MKLSMTATTLASSLIAGHPSAGVSDEARFVLKQEFEACERIWQSDTLSNRPLLEDLRELLDECSLPNWDGYGARPLHPDAVNVGSQLIRALPVGTAKPTISADPDGQVSIEWYSSPSRSVSISIAADGVLHYSALMGTASQYGSEVFLGALPKPIAELIDRVLAT